MGEDESKALRILDSNKKIHKKWISRFNGELLKEMGDGMLASFPTISDSVHCAIAIMLDANKIPDLQLRIGIHQGEIVHDGTEVYGDGINIASRIQTIAEKGEILVSETIFNNVKNKGISLVFKGRHELKNIAEPINTYSLKIEGFDTNKLKRTKVRRKGKSVILSIVLFTLVLVAVYQFLILEDSKKKEGYDSSLVVLPFENIGNDSLVSFLLDGLVEDLTTKLSLVEELRLISRTTANTYKKSSKTVKEISDELNTRFVLEGSGRSMNNQIKLTFQLIDASDDRHVWATDTTLAFSDIFLIQSKLSNKISKSLELKLTKEQSEYFDDVMGTTTEVIELNRLAYDSLAHATGQQSLNFSIKLLKEALQKDPLYSNTYYNLAMCFYEKYWYDSPKSDWYDSTLFYLNKLIAQNPKNSKYLYSRASLFKRNRQVNQYKQELEGIASIDPNHPSKIELGYIQVHEGNYEKGIKNILNYYSRNTVYDERFIQSIIPQLYYDMGDYESALLFAKKVLEKYPKDYSNLDLAMECYFYYGKYDSALLIAESMQGRLERFHFQGLFYSKLGDYSNSLANYKLYDSLIRSQEISLTKSSFPSIMRLGFATAMAGDKIMGLKMVDAYYKYIKEKLESSDYFWNYGEYYDLAICSAFLGNKPESIKWLRMAQDKSKEGGFFYTSYLLHDPMLDNIRQDPEFKRILSEELENDNTIKTVFHNELYKMNLTSEIKDFKSFFR